MRHPKVLAAAAEAIRGIWQAQGFAVTEVPFEVAGAPAMNLQVEVKGDRAVSEWLVIGAHYDSAHGLPGADDNASGLAGLLELSRLFSPRFGSQENQLPPAVGLRFVAFTNEEPP